MTRIDKVRQILGDLHYQTYMGVTTMGPCANGCGNAARGSGVCSECLTLELAGHAGESLARKYHSALKEYKLLHESILELSYE